MSDDPTDKPRIRELSFSSVEDSVALESTLERLVSLAERTLPLREALNSGDPIRIADAKEPAQAALEQYGLLVNEISLRLNVALIEGGEADQVRERLRRYVAKLAESFERMRAQLDNIDYLFRSTGKEIGDA